MIFDKTAHSTLWYAVLDYIRVHQGQEMPWIASSIKAMVIRNVGLPVTMNYCYACEACGERCEKCPIDVSICSYSGLSGLYNYYCIEYQAHDGQLTPELEKIIMKIAEGKVKKDYNGMLI